MSALTDCSISSFNDINTKSLEFSPAFFGAELLYIGTNEDEKGLDKNIGEPYFNAKYYSFSNEANRGFQLANINKVHEHIGPLHYDKTHEKIYYTQSKKYKRGKLKPVNKIMVSTRDTSFLWSEGKEISINSTQWSVQHPTLSSDGKMLIFSGNAPGGIGSYDLWQVIWQDSSWSSPVNLGPGVNSFDNEAFPVLYKDSLLLFASNGRGGMGQYDIFASIYQDGMWQNAINLGRKINSIDDDFGLILDDASISGYFSSNRTGGLGKDDIYHITFKRPLITISERLPIAPIAKREYFDITLSLQASADKNVIPDVFVTLIPFTNDVNNIWEAFEIESIETIEGQNRFLMNVIPKSKSNEVKTKLSDDQGKLIFQLEKNKEYLLTMQKEGFRPYTTTIGGESPVADLLIFLEKSVVKTEPIVSEVKELDKENDSEKIIKEEPTPVENEMDKELKTSLDNFELVVFDQIFYKYNSSKISPASTDQLDQLAYYMTNYPGIKVELTAHTDCRGHRAFNQKLSLSRALSAKDYLIGKGISPDRVLAIGRGEDEVRNHCTDGVYCTEKEHEYNRRTEVRVIMNE
jgi:outer membrane protein OmpA-like peptidoglycan-associated protein